MQRGVCPGACVFVLLEDGGTDVGEGAIACQARYCHVSYALADFAGGAVVSKGHLPIALYLFHIA